MVELPEERTGSTDMTFSLIRFEVANIFRRILYIPPGPVRCTELFANLSIADKEKWITECHHRIEEKYLKDCDMSIPICWVTATVSRLIMSKMWLIVYHPHQRKDGGVSLPQETKDKLFITSLENVEYSILLETEARTMKWGWLFRTYAQWHAIAFLLSELCVRTKGEAVERAWRALEATAGCWWFPLNDVSPYRKGLPGCLWKPLEKLLVKAKAAREREIRLEQASRAVRNGQRLNADFPWIAPGTLPPIPGDQPNSENLDKLLRPSAPKLGEIPIDPVPAMWPEHPVSSKSSSSIDGLGSQNLEQTPMAQSRSSTMLESRTTSPGQHFNSLTDFGLDNVLLDVMDGASFAPLSTISQGQDPPNPMQTTHAGFVTAAQPIVSGEDNLMSGVFAPDQNFFGDPSFGAVATNGQEDDSPMLDSGPIDWQIWDDMVNQFGIEGQTGHNSNPAGPGHLGLMHFM